MKNNLVKIAFLGLVTAALLTVPNASRAADATNTPAATMPKKNGLPFHGKVTAVDTNAMTLTVGTMTYNVVAATKIVKAGKPVTLADLTVGETVGGAYKKDDAGKLNATLIRVGPKGEKKKKAATDTTAPAAN